MTKRPSKYHLIYNNQMVVVVRIRSWAISRTIASKPTRKINRLVFSQSLSDLEVTGDFSDVRFVVEAYRRLLDSNIAGETVNICSSVGVALGEIIERMNRIAGYTIEVRVNPALVRANEVRQLIGDNHKLRCGWSVNSPSIR